MCKAIEATDIVKVYGDNFALDHISLDVREGEIFGFLGPNGAGKSTFVKILLNLVFSTQGSAKIFSTPVENFRSRNNVGYLPENMKAYDVLSVEEFLLHSAVLSGMSGAEIRSEVSEKISLFSLQDKRNKKMSSLSKGLLQKVGIIQAVLGRPRLVFFDEPTTGLDPIAIKQLRRMIMELKEAGTTVFLNSHLLSEVERTCDRIAILNRGKILKTGSKEELSNRDKHLEAEVDGITEPLVNKLNELSTRPVERDGKTLIIYPRTKQDGVDIHRIIIQHGTELSSLSWKGETLEELFYRVVKNENTGNL